MLSTLAKGHTIPEIEEKQKNRYTNKHTPIHVEFVLSFYYIYHRQYLYRGCRSGSDRGTMHLSYMRLVQLP